jgi:hypothetical protein
MSLDHIILRANERYKLHLTKRDVRYILKLIGSGSAEHIPGPMGNNTWRVKYQDTTLAVATIKDRFGRLHINTILPESYAMEGFKLSIITQKRRHNDTT